MTGEQQTAAYPDQAAEALKTFKSRLHHRYGKRLKGLYLFGSRAKGNHRPDSDADIAVFLQQVDNPIREQLELMDEGYPILLETGLYIQPWVFESDALEHPERYQTDQSLLEAIRREGKAL